MHKASVKRFHVVTPSWRLSISDDETSCAEDEQEVPAAPASPKEKFYPDGGWGWVVALGSALSHFLVVGLGRSFGLFYLTLLDMFQDSAAATSLVVAIYNTTRQMLGKFTLDFGGTVGCRYDYDYDYDDDDDDDHNHRHRHHQLHIQRDYLGQQAPC